MFDSRDFVKPALVPLLAFALTALTAPLAALSQGRLDGGLVFDGATNAAPTQDGAVRNPTTVTTAPPSRSNDYRSLSELIWRSVNTREVVRARLYLENGVMDERVVQQLAHLLRDIPTGRPSPVVRRTLKLITKAAYHFGALEIDVVSAYRTGRSASGRRVRHEGYHSVGSAIDFRFPNVDMVQVAAYARTFAHVGVGYYPETNFVHLDSREQSYFWENRASRGRRGWDRPLARPGADERDRNWVLTDDEPWDPPGGPPVLVLHPETAGGVTRSSHRRRHRSRHHRSRHHPSLRPFLGHRSRPINGAG